MTLTTLPEVPRVPLPKLRTLAKLLRDTNAAFTHPLGGPEYVTLALIHGPNQWMVRCVGETGDFALAVAGRELIPGNDTLDATAAARRLLAAARDLGFQ